MFASHEENNDLVSQINVLASELGIGVAHNASSLAKHDGYHRYLVYSQPELGKPSISHKRCIDYWETRYSRDYQPSKSGERSCLRGVLRWLQTEAPSLAHTQREAA